MKKQLEVYRSFQDKYNHAHVGGSVGLFLHGIDLKRDMSKSDLDITVKCKLPNDGTIDIEGSEPASNNEDYDYKFRVHIEGGYVKMDIRHSTEPSFQVINFNGYGYQVSKLEDILFWKQKYADKGVTKHIEDLVVINGGERPIPIVVDTSDLDDLPF